MERERPRRIGQTHGARHAGHDRVSGMILRSRRDVQTHPGVPTAMLHGLARLIGQLHEPLGHAWIQANRRPCRAQPSATRQADADAELCAGDRGANEHAQCA